MRDYTHTYNAARQAGAKPFILAFIETDRCLRVFGKQTPLPAYIRENKPLYFGANRVYFSDAASPVFLGLDTGSVLEWSARVLTFGDFRQSLSQDSESIVDSLTEKVMDSYTIELDNHDDYFTDIAAKETLLNGSLLLKQGYDYPGFVYSDFITLFPGSITSYNYDYISFSITADQALESAAPTDPTVDITTTYALSVGGSGETGASATYTHVALANNFYSYDSWTETYDIVIDTPAQEQTFFAIENQSFSKNRIEVGTDASGYARLIYTNDVNEAFPTFTTVTTDYVLSSGHNTIQVYFDAENWQVTITDGNGNSYSEYVYAYTSQFGSSGSGNGQFSTPLGIAVDSNDNIFVVDQGNYRIQKFDSAGTYVTQWGSNGTGNGQFQYPIGIAVDSNDNVFVVDQTRDDVQKFQNDGTYVTKFGSSGYGDGEFAVPIGLAIDSSDNIFVSDYSRDDIQKFDSAGTFIKSFGSGVLNNPGGLVADTALIDDIYVTDRDDDVVYKFTNDGVYIKSIGGSGSGDGLFNRPTDIAISPEGYLFVTDNNNDRFQVFNETGGWMFSVSWSSCWGIDIQSDSTAVVGKSNIIRLHNVVNYDMADTGANDILKVGVDFTGEIISASHSNAPGYASSAETRYVNRVGASESVFTDIASSLDLTVDDGVWEAYGESWEETTAADSDSPATAFADVILDTPAIYTNPGQNQQNLILPLPYGDLTENSGAGVWVCPLIDSANYVYCVAGWPILSVADGNVVSVYVDGVLQSSGYTFDESNDYESQGNIAILTFAADQGDKTVTVKAKGKETSEGSGILLTNPIDVIEDWMDYATGKIDTASWEQDTTTFSIARAQAESYGYTCAGVIQANQSLGFWLQNILNSFLGSFRFGSDGTLQVFLQEAQTTSAVQEYFDEHEALSLNVSKEIQNVFNRILINYAVAYTSIDRRFKNAGEKNYYLTADETTGSDVASISKYGVKTKEFDFDWTRNTNGVELCQDILLDLYNEAEFTITYQGQDFKYIPLELTDQIQGTLSLVKDADGVIEEDVIYELRAKTHNLDNFTTILTMQSINFIDVDTNHAIYFGISRVYFGLTPVFVEV